MSLEKWRRERIHEAERSGEVIKITGSRSLATPGPDSPVALDAEFAALERAFADAGAALAAAKVAERAAYDLLHAARYRAGSVSRRRARLVVLAHRRSSRLASRNGRSSDLAPIGPNLEKRSQ